MSWDSIAIMFCACVIGLLLLLINVEVWGKRRKPKRRKGAGDCN